MNSTDKEETRRINDLLKILAKVQKILKNKGTPKPNISRKSAITEIEKDIREYVKDGDYDVPIIDNQIEKIIYSKCFNTYQLTSRDYEHFLRFYEDLKSEARRQK